MRQIVVKYSTWIAGVLFLYGHICRYAKIYFFWESDDVGLELFIFLGLFVLISKLRRRVILKRKGLAIGGIVILSFLLIVQVVIVSSFVNKGLPRIAFTALQNTKEVTEELGDVTSFSLTPQGELSDVSTNDAKLSSAKFTLIIKGTKRYADISVLLENKNDNGWRLMKYIVD